MLCRFCVTYDREWIVSYCSGLRTSALLSVRSGTIAWSYSLPESLPDAQCWWFRPVCFDASQRHFLLFGEQSITAFAPAALNADVPSSVQTTYLEDLQSEDDSANAMNVQGTMPFFLALIKLSSMVSPEAFSWTLCDVPRRALVSWLGTRSDQLFGNTQESKRMDVVISQRSSCLACITEEADETRNVRICWPTSADSANVNAHDFAGLRFPLNAESGRHGFKPSRLRFYSDGERDGMVLLSMEDQVSVMFCELSNETWDIVDPGVEPCFAFSLTADRKTLCLLDATSVYILNLSERTVVDRIHYKINFCELRDANGSGVARQLRLQRCIADDGRSVVLGWEKEGPLSIVVTPSTEQQQCQEQILNARGGLSYDIDLSGNAQCTFHWIPESSTSFRSSMRSVSGNATLHVTCIVRGEMTVFGEISPDGTIFTTLVLLAPVTSHNEQSMTLCLQQYSLYCAEEFISDYQHLQETETAASPHAVNQLVREYGAFVLNGPPSRGMSIAQSAIINEDAAVTSFIKKMWNQQGTELSLDWLDTSGVRHDLISEALTMNSTNGIRNTLELIGVQRMPFVQTASLMKKHFKALCLQHRDILKNALSENNFVLNTCQVRVYVMFLNPIHRKHTGLHVTTMDDFYCWKNGRDLDVLGKKWQERNKKVVEDLEKDGSKSTEIANLQFICIEDAAKTGMKGILRPLLLRDMPADIFKTDAIKWIIEYKWNKIWKRRFWRCAVQYAGRLGCFTSYVIILGGSADISGEESWSRAVTTVLAFLNFVFGVLLLKEEIMQLWSLAEDGKQLGGRLIGVRYYFRSRWNRVDLVSCFLLLVCIPLFHTLELHGSGCGKFLSASAAVEAVLVYMKVWYFAQPFRDTGAQVLMIANIVKDSKFFMFLAFVILCGFAFGLRVLFRHTVQGALEEFALMNATTVLNSSTSNTILWIRDEEVQAAYGTPWRSFLTLFYALLGDFDPEMYYSAKDMPWLLSGMFVIYLISIVILLLNLLISTMGDTFDRVKNTEEAQLLKGRAKFIDACEAALSETERDKIDEGVQKYLCALVDLDNKCDEEPPDHWTGKLSAIDRRLRTHIQETEEKTHRLMQKQEERIAATVQTRVDALEARMTAAMQEQEGRMTAAMQEQEGRMTAVLQEQEGRMTAAMERRLAETTDQLQRTMEEINQATQTRLDQLLSLLQSRQQE